MQYKLNSDKLADYNTRLTNEKIERLPQNFNERQMRAFIFAISHEYCII